MKINNKKKGMTLIEAIISVALLSLLIIPISGLVTNSAKTNKKGEVKQQSVYLGQKMLEEIKAYGGMTLNSTIFTFLDGGILTKTNTGYTAELTRAVDGDTSGKSYKVKVILDKDNNFNFNGSNNKGDNSDADQIINISQEGEIIKAEVNSRKVSIVNDVILKISNPMDISLYNNGETTPIIFNPKVSINNKIMIYLENGFNKALNIKLENKKSNNVDIYIVKNSNTTGSVNVTSSVGKTTIYEDLLEVEESKIGNLYKVSVEVFNENGNERLFDGTTTVNLNIK